MLLTPIGWANRVWALPFLTALAPSQRYYAEKGCPHKTLTDWARQLLLQLKRWVGQRQVIAVEYIAVEYIAVEYFVRRWSMEVTFAQVRAHLGVETQRQWSHKAIGRTTPVLLGLFSLVSLLADRLWQKGLLIKQDSSWYEKTHLTFADALASVRTLVWQEVIFHT